MLKPSFDILFLKKAVRELVSMILDDVERILRPLRLIPFAPPVKPKNQQGFQVLITGGYGYGNVGDEAQLNTNLMRWKHAVPTARIIVLSPHPDYTASHHGVHAENAPRVVWFDSNRRAYYWAANSIFAFRFYLVTLRQLVAARLMNAGLPPIIVSAEEAHLLHLIRRADILHISGGGFLTGMTRSRLWGNALLLRLAYIFGTPSILTGQTIGIFQSAADRSLARWGLRHSKAIYLRDKYKSQQDLENIGISGNHVQSFYDDALFCDKASEETVDDTLTQSGLDPAKPYIVVNYHYWGMSHKMRRRATSRFAELCDHLSQLAGRQVLLLPMTPSDEKPLDDLHRQLHTPSCILSYGYDFRLARGVIAKAVCVFTMKHHPIIFAQGECVPVVSVCLDDYYYHKNKGAMANFGHEHYCMDEQIFFSSESAAVLGEFCKELPRLRMDMQSQLVIFRAKEAEILNACISKPS